MAIEARLRTRKEQQLFAIGVGLSSLFWLALAISVVGIAIGLGLLVILFVGHALFLAHVRGNGVRVSAKQFPDLFQRSEAAARKLGMATVPDIYVLQSGGALNAFATKFFGRNFVIIFSSLIESCVDPRQVDFIIGHEIGHIAAGHLKWNWFLFPFTITPWLGAAYSRAREYTCDRCGASVVGDLEPALRGLCVLAAGGKLAMEANVDEFMDQRRESGTFWLAVVELGSSHPFLCKRVAALREFSAAGSIIPVRRTPLAYPFAPLLGFGGALTSLFVALTLRSFVVEAFKIPSGSMIPTLQIGDQLFTDKTVYKLRQPRRGEVIVFTFPVDRTKDFIKRVVGIAGDSVEFNGRDLLVNGKALPKEAVAGPCHYEERNSSDAWSKRNCDAYKESNGEASYSVVYNPEAEQMRPLDGRFTVPEGSVFVVGDNRDNSYDSRMWGAVPNDLIKGRATLVWWSWGEEGLRWPRLGTRVQ